jgi:RimJ/RimL family protein N-acetyltransferase
MTDLLTWTPRPTPGLSTLEGRLVRLEPFDPVTHAAGLFDAVGGEANAALWHWMPAGPFPTPAAISDFLAAEHAAQHWNTLVIRAISSGSGSGGLDSGSEVLGMATYMRIREAHGSAEIGCVAFGPRLKRTREATEALTLMAAHVFDLGYRRYEWKCNDANLASKRAAVRFGFSFEGIFRNDMVMKGRSRDTAWYSIIDAEWPRLKAALDQWLAPANFAADGAQMQTLESFRST